MRVRRMNPVTTGHSFAFCRVKHGKYKIVGKAASLENAEYLARRLRYSTECLKPTVIVKNVGGVVWQEDIHNFEFFYEWPECYYEDSEGKWIFEDGLANALAFCRRAGIDFDLAYGS